MSLFKKETQKINVLQCGLPLEKGNFQHLVSACAGKAAANQKACAEIVVKNYNWQVDFKKGTLAFGPSEFPVQFIGTVSDTSNTWLWAWDNPSPIPDAAKQDSFILKKLGTDIGIAEFITPELEIGGIITIHTILMAAAILNEENVCYYRGPYSGGAAGLIFKDLPDEVFKPVKAPEFANITMSMIQQFELDHRIFLESFLIQNRCKYEWMGNKLTAIFPDRDKLVIALDDLGRITSIKSA